MANAHYLTDKDGVKFYPYGHTNAVFSPDGTKLEKRLNDLEDGIHIHENQEVLDTIDSEDITKWDTSVQNVQTLADDLAEEITRATTKENELENIVESLQNAKDITTTTDPTMYNSHPGRVLINEIGGGETQQGSTTGAQLFDASNIDKGNNTSLTVSDDGYTIVAVGGTDNSTSGYCVGQFVMDLTVFTGRILYLKADSITRTQSDQGYIQIRITYTDGTYAYIPLTPDKLSVSLEIPEDVTEVLFGIYTSNKLLDTDNTLTVKGLILSFDENAEWEPYTGGQPSPNQEYPQEIEATVVNEIKTVGKNLLNFVATRNSLLYLLPIKVGDSFTVSYEYLDTSVDIRCALYIFDEIGSYASVDLEGEHQLQKTSVYYAEENKRTSITITANYDGYLYFRQVVPTNYANITNFQIEEGTEATDYEPYTETVKKLSNPITLYKIGDVQDKILGGNVVRKFKKVVFDGSEEWTVYNVGNENAFFEINRLDKYIAPLALCSHFTYNYIGSGSFIEGFSTDSSTYTIRFRPSDVATWTLDNWKEWLSTNNVFIVYLLNNPIIEPLPLSDKLSLSSLPTYSTVTHLSTDAEIEPTYELKYGISEVGGLALQACAEGCNTNLKMESNDFDFETEDINFMAEY